jgi:hypothetical protein
MAAGSYGTSLRTTEAWRVRTSKDHDSSGAGGEDGRGLVAQVLDQAPDIIGVSLEPMIVVLRPIELAPGKAASIVGDNGVVRR